MTDEKYCARCLWAAWAFAMLSMVLAVAVGLQRAHMVMVGRELDKLNAEVQKAVAAKAGQPGLKYAPEGFVWCDGCLPPPAYPCPITGAAATLKSFSWALVQYESAETEIVVQRRDGVVYSAEFKRKN